VQREYGLPVISIAALDDLLAYLQGKRSWCRICMRFKLTESVTE